MTVFTVTVNFETPDYKDRTTAERGRENFMSPPVPLSSAGGTNHGTAVALPVLQFRVKFPALTTDSER